MDKLSHKNILGRHDRHRMVVSLHSKIKYSRASLTRTRQKPKPNEQETAHTSKNNAVIVTEVQVYSNPEPCTVNNGGEEIELLSSTYSN